MVNMTIGYSEQHKCNAVILKELPADSDEAIKLARDEKAVYREFCSDTERFVFQFPGDNAPTPYKRKQFIMELQHRKLLLLTGFQVVLKISTRGGKARADYMGEFLGKTEVFLRDQEPNGNYYYLLKIYQKVFYPSDGRKSHIERWSDGITNVVQLKKILEVVAC